MVGSGERSWCTLQNYEFNFFLLFFFFFFFFFLRIMQNILARTHEWMRDRNQFCKRLNNCSVATLSVVRLILEKKHARFKKNCPNFIALDKSVVWWDGKDCPYLNLSLNSQADGKFFLHFLSLLFYFFYSLSLLFFLFVLSTAYFCPRVKLMRRSRQTFFNQCGLFLACSVARG